LVEGSNIGALE